MGAPQEKYPLDPTPAETIPAYDNNVKEKLCVTKTKTKQQAGNILRSLKVLLLRPFPPTLVVNLPDITNPRTRRDKEDDMALLLDCDVLQNETEELGNYEDECELQEKEVYIEEEEAGADTGEIGVEKETRSRFRQVMRVSKKVVWNYMVDYFCPSYMLARDIENYIPDYLIYDGDNVPLLYDGDNRREVFAYNGDENEMFGQERNGIFQFDTDHAREVSLESEDVSQIAGPSSPRSISRDVDSIEDENKITVHRSLV